VSPIDLRLGDCLDVLRTLPDNSVDSVVTDPPYGLSFMGKRWDYDVPSVEVWAECLRVLKPGGHLLAFAGTRTQHRMAIRIEDAGFEIRDMIAWVYGSGFPKSLDVVKAIGEEDPAAIQWQGWGTALKPALEPITVARKPLCGTVAANVLAWGTGAINVDGGRVPSGESQSRPRGSFPHSDDAWGNGRPAEVSESSPLGRFPANLIHDGSDEVVGLFPETHGAGTFRSGSSAGNVFAARADEGPENQRPALDNGGSAARFFYCAKASKADRDEGCGALPMRTAGEMTNREEGADGLNSPRAGAGRGGGARNFHPTVKPTDLMRYLCRLVTQPGGTVLDPFMGSGSTGKGAMAEGFRFIGIERDPDYFKIAEARVASGIPRQPELF
jgi:site-specific DNA-methyltransferase (adenine-specific)